MFIEFKLKFQITRESYMKFLFQFNLVVLNQKFNGTNEYQWIWKYCVQFNKRRDKEKKNISWIEAAFKIPIERKSETTRKQIVRYKIYKLFCKFGNWKVKTFVVVIALFSLLYNSLRWNRFVLFNSPIEIIGIQLFNYLSVYGLVITTVSPYITILI